MATTAKYVTIEELLRKLQTLVARGLDTREVHDYLLATLIEPASLENYLSFRPDHYARNLIYKSDAFELLAICWEGGQKAPIHGHEGERCWSRVERGTLRFTNYREVSEKPLVLERLAEPFHGKRGHLDGPADIHEVENLLSFDEKAVSLHLYSRPYLECDIYDLAQGKKERVRLTYDTMFGKPVSP
ncbi:MAG: cysteine dioxygenase [Candidatus Binatia bacterium]